MLQHLISYQCYPLVICLLMVDLEDSLSSSFLPYFFYSFIKVWPDMTHMLKPWKINTLIGVVLFVMIYPCPPSTLKCNIWEGTLVSILTSMAHFVADNSKFELLGFISPPVHCLLIFHYVLCSFSLKKMGRSKNKICPDSDSKESSTGGSAHKGKSLNQWPAGIQFLQILI